MTRRHTHPCAYCKTPVECDGTIARNYDGWPEAICAAYHLDGGGVQHLLCDACLRADDLQHDADTERNGPQIDD